MNKEEALKKIEELMEFIENCNREETLIEQVRKIFDGYTQKPHSIKVGNADNIIILNYKKHYCSSHYITPTMVDMLHKHGFYIIAIGHNPDNCNEYHRIWLEKR